jgi:hypothetical protein
MVHEPVEPGGARAEDVQERSRRFASLRAAQRALADTLHPHELQRSVEQGRAVLVTLQSLSLRSKAAGGEPVPAMRDLDAIDSRLDDISARIREILDRVTISELRSSLPLLSSEQPETLRGLIDVVLEGDRENPKSLRLLEYLVTLLSCEERGRRRVVTRQPLEVAPSLRIFSDGVLDETDSALAAAEQIFERASEALPEDEEFGLLRDRVRRYKQELGVRILQPRVLAAAVAYNVAMWNRLTDVIEGSRTLDRLAEDLLELDDDAPDPTHSIFDSAGFARVVHALRMRLSGDPGTDAPGANLVAGFELGHLTAVELEFFDIAEEDHAASLVCYAVTLGLSLRSRPRIDAALEALDIDVEILGNPWLREMAREMMATARKLLAEGHYVEASRLLDLKTDHLDIQPAHSELDSDGPAPGAWREDASRQRRSGPAAFRAAFMLLGLGIGVLLAAPLFRPPELELRPYSGTEIAELSPLLLSGQRDTRNGRTRFVGVLKPSWRALDTKARNEMATSVGEVLLEQGVEGVVLVDGHHRIQARVESGTVIEVLARPAGPNETAP